MDSKKERRKALVLSVVGAVAILIIVYGSAWLLIYVVSLTSQVVKDESTVSSSAEFSQPDTNQQDLTQQTIGDLEIKTQSFTESAPYQFTLTTYIFAGINESTQSFANSYNQQINQFIDDQRDNFEADLQSFFGSVDSPDSYLSISSIHIGRQQDMVLITYQIETFFAGDSGPTQANKVLTLN